MTATREAIVLPFLFLTVALVGGLRPGAQPLFAPPILFALVLAALLIGSLVQSDAFDPRRVINPSRSVLANVNGICILATLFAGSGQAFSLLIPESGLPRILFSVYFLVMMLNTMAVGPDRVRMLRSLAMMFGVAFVLRFVVLDALSDPAEGRLGRALQLLLEGATLGAVTQEVQHPAAGYIAFGALTMFLIAIWLLPERTRREGALVTAQIGNLDEPGALARRRE